MLSGREHLQAELLVRHVRSADDHGLDLVVVQQLLHAAVARASFEVGDLGGVVGGDIAHGDERRARHGAQCGHVRECDAADPHDSDAQRRSLLGHCCPFLMSRPGRAAVGRPEAMTAEPLT